MGHKARTCTYVWYGMGVRHGGWDDQAGVGVYGWGLRRLSVCVYDMRDGKVKQMYVYGVYGWGPWRLSVCECKRSAGQ